MILKIFLTLATTALGAAPVPFKTDKLALQCGNADPMVEYIHETMGELSIQKIPISRPPLHGESGRQIIIYNDGSWFLLVEYFTPRDIKYDVMCIVDKGPREAMDGLETRDFKLPPFPPQVLGKIHEPMPRECAPTEPARRIKAKLKLPSAQAVFTQS